MEFKKHPIFIVSTGIIIALGRFLMHEITDDTIKNYVNLVFMAVVNFVAFGIVILFIHSEAQIYCEKKINASGISTIDKKKKLKILNFISFSVMILYLSLGILYIVVFRDADLNDAISIVALSFSIATNDLSVSLGKIYFNFCKKNKKRKAKEQD